MKIFAVDKCWSRLRYAFTNLVLFLSIAPWLIGGQSRELPREVPQGKNATRRADLSSDK